jgi:hypothetical protein
MSPDRTNLRRAFQRPAVFPVRITPKGFVVEGELLPLPALRGRIAKTVLVRKLFEDGFLVCDSKDGIRSRKGVLCDECRHPSCRPLVRMQLADGPLVHLLDLPFTSAKNFFALEDEAQRAGVSLASWLLELTVTDHETWGEVRFTRL